MATGDWIWSTVMYFKHFRNAQTFICFCALATISVSTLWLYRERARERDLVGWLRINEFYGLCNVGCRERGLLNLAHLVWKRSSWGSASPEAIALLIKLTFLEHSHINMTVHFEPDSLDWIMKNEAFCQTDFDVLCKYCPDFWGSREFSSVVPIFQLFMMHWYIYCLKMCVWWCSEFSQLY